MGVSSIRTTTSRIVREALLHKDIASSGRGRSILFFPSYWRSDSSLLRVDLVADVLRERGWRCYIVPPHFS
ncbi:MAG: hypothetical protein AAF360_16600, partial [Pseudomonadota bacterium]